MAFFQTENLWVNELADGVAALVLDVQGSIGNSLSLAMLKDLGRALDAIEEAGRFRLLLLRSGKSSHFARGPGIEDLATFRTAEDFANLAKQGQEVLNRLAALAIPSVAVIAGSCQGGGLELALACDYRVLVDEPKTRLGFSDLEVGLSPAWGGTQRLPRIIGLERSLHMLLGDRQLAAFTALEWGLADAVVQSSQSQPPDFLDHPEKRTRHGLPLRTWRQRLMEGFRGGRWLILRGMERILKRRVPDDLPAPWEILALLRQGPDQDMAAGLKKEKEALVRLGQSDAFRNLLQARLMREQIRQVRFPSQDARRLRRIGVVGAGTRGSQLVFLAVTRGCQVVIRERDETALGTALFQLLPLFQQAVRQGNMPASDVQKNLAAINGTTAWKGFADLDLVLESAGADVKDPAKLFQELEAQTGPETMLIAASGRSLQELRKNLKDPDRVAGLHFVSPVSKGSVVEVVQGPSVKPAMVRELAAWVVHLGGLPILVRDSPGHLVQRVWLAAIHEALLLLQQGFAVERIDESLRRFGMTRGPLELADLIGLNRLADLAATLSERFPGMGVFCSRMVSNGWRGHKTKLGFYQYDKRRRPSNPHVRALARELKDPSLAEEGPLSTSEQDSVVRNRIVARTINEAAWCWQEEVVKAPEDLDLAMTASGWAPHRGGPLTYARQQGIDVVILWLNELARERGPRFLPCPALEKLRT